MKNKMVFAIALTALLSMPLSAALIYDSTLTLSGQGLGAVATIMTMQGNGDLETGCSAWNGTVTIAGAAACSSTGAAYGITGADTKNGASQTGSPTLGSMSISDASNIIIVFNATEPAGNSIQLEQLILNLFRADGTLYYTAALDPIFTPTLFTNTNQGIGKAGFSFRLDSIQSAEAQALGILSTDRVGLEASASLQAGGPETFSLGNAAGFIPGEDETVPEPATYLSLGLGLTLLGIARGKRKLWTSK